jgi:hypothetical protein
LLDQFGWALVERSASGLAMNVLKPDVLFYHYSLQRFVGLWVGENNPALLETIRRQLTEWQQQQSSLTIRFPLGLLIKAKNEVQLIMTQATPPLSGSELSQLPTQL